MIFKTYQNFPVKGGKMSYLSTIIVFSAIGGRYGVQVYETVDYGEPDGSDYTHSLLLHSHHTGGQNDFITVNLEYLP